MTRQERHPFGALIILAILTLGLTGCSGTEANVADQPSSQAQKTPSDASTQPAMKAASIPVQVVPVQRVDVPDMLDLTGTAKPWDEFIISSEVTGRVVAILVEEGAWVEKGQLLAEIDREKREIELQSRKANLARTRVDLQFAKRRQERGQLLLEKGAISQADLDTLDQAVQVQETSVQMAEISIRSMEMELDDTRIRSEVTGRVAVRHVSLGETLNPSSPLFTIIQVSPIKVVTEIPEPYLHKIRTGASVGIIFEAVSDKARVGTVHFVHPMANPDSGSFPTEIRLKNGNRMIRPGMVARVELKAQIYAGVLVVPTDALVDIQGLFYVFVVRDDRATRVPVELFRRMGDDVIVEGELEADELVVTQGNVNLTDGTPVGIIS